jgi:malate synthase
MNAHPNTLEITGPVASGYAEILSDEALAFLSALASEFSPRVAELLDLREQRQQDIDGGKMPDFLSETREIRESDWKVCAVPDDLEDRRVEITGPTERKMIINALNSGAKVFMADCEDSQTPTWDNVVQGHINLRDAASRKIEHEVNGKHYALNKQIATLIVRPRGWHLPEKHILLQGQPVPGALVDFGLYLFHSAAELKKQGTGPYFYLPKLESHLEARLWSDVFKFAERAGVVDAGEIKVTVLIETILAAFEMDEILYELREHIVGQNCGRWDYIFSFIKKFSRYPEFVLPDRVEVTMTSHFLRSYSELVIKTCHRRGAYAIGGMAAQIPIKNDPQANASAIAKVRADKEREVRAGHDGTWVAHPGLVSLAMEIFDEHMPGPNQLERLLEDLHVGAADLLQVVKGKITETGLRDNINVAVRYMASWLGGNGCVPLNNLMEDAATAEISRAQVWQWVHHATGVLDEGRNITYDLFRGLLREEMEKIREQVGDSAFKNGHYRRAAQLLDEITEQDVFAPFLTTVAYADIG